MQPGRLKGELVFFVPVRRVGGDVVAVFHVIVAEAQDQFWTWAIVPDVSCYLNAFV